MAVSAGDLIHRVTIQIRGGPGLEDEAGQELADWVDVEEVWAQVKPAGGSELYRAGGLAVEADHLVTMYFYSGLTSLHRLVYEGRVLDINRVVNVGEMSVWHELFCKESL